jgi:hypothetical protein
MIIAPRFDGDLAEGLQLEQGRLYPDALGVLFGAARNALSNAEGLLETNSPLGDLVRTNRYDSGYLGLIHDTLAAIWRAGHDHLQAELPVAGRDDKTSAREWLDWLRDRASRMAPGVHRTLLLAAYDDSEETTQRVAALLAELERELKQTAEGRAKARAGSA